jgi:hypothetical protein
MAYICQNVVEIPFLCSNASQRLVHMSFFSDSQITRPALKINTSQATIVIGPNVISTASTWQSSGTSVGPGIYHLVLTQSECSSQGVPGYTMLYTSTLTTGPYYVRLYFPRVDSYNTQDYGLMAFSGVTLAAGTHSGATIQGVSRLNSGVTLNAGTHSDATIKGIENYRNISNVTLHAGTHSDVTIQGLTRINSAVTLNAGSHSGATIKGIENYANISSVTLNAGTHSGATVQGLSNYANISNVTLHAGTHSGATVRGVENYANLPTLVELAASSITSMAIAVVNRTIDNTGFGGRTVGSALAGIRNKVVITASTITVYDTDDTTVLWGGEIVAGGTPLSSVDPS